MYEQNHLFPHSSTSCSHSSHLIWSEGIGTHELLVTVLLPLWFWQLYIFVVQREKRLFAEINFAGFTSAARQKLHYCTDVSLRMDFLRTLMLLFFFSLGNRQNHQSKVHTQISECTSHSFSQRPVHPCFARATYPKHGLFHQARAEGTSEKPCNI